MEYGGGIVMHVGTFPFAGEHLGAERLLAVLKQFPKLKIMVAHMGFFETEEFWRIMDRYPGVCLDTAFLLGNPAFVHA
jgi:predicted TIM-barrel fold metal-dependent hydrolase